MSSSPLSLDKTGRSHRQPIDALKHVHDHYQRYGSPTGRPAEFCMYGDGCLIALIDPIHADGLSHAYRSLEMCTLVNCQYYMDCYWYAIGESSATPTRDAIAHTSSHYHKPSDAIIRYKKLVKIGGPRQLLSTPLTPRRELFSSFGVVPMKAAVSVPCDVSVPKLPLERMGALVKTSSGESTPPTPPVSNISTSNISTSNIPASNIPASPISRSSSHPSSILTRSSSSEMRSPSINRSSSSEANSMTIRGSDSKSPVSMPLVGSRDPTPLSTSESPQRRVTIATPPPSHRSSPKCRPPTEQAQRSPTGHGPAVVKRMLRGTDVPSDVPSRAALEAKIQSQDAQILQLTDLVNKLSAQVNALMNHD